MRMIILGCILSATIAGFAQPDGPNTTGKINLSEASNLAELIQFAETQNPGLQSDLAKWQAATQQASSSGKLPNPTITYGYMAQSLNDFGETRENRFTVNQGFPWFGTLHQQRKIAEADANRELARYERTKRDLHFRIKASYFEYALIRQKLAIISNNIQLMQDVEEVVLAKFRTGENTYATLLKIQVELERLNDEQKSYEQLLPVTHARLNYLLNRPADAVLPVDPQIELDTLAIDFETLAATLSEKNPDLQIATATSEQSRSALKLVQKSNYPVFGLGIQYQQMGNMNGVNLPDPVMISVSMSLPLWFGKNKAAVAAAQTRKKAADFSIDNVRNMLLADLQVTLFGYKDAYRKIRLYETKLIPKARQALEVSQTAFETGKMDFLDWIDAQRTLLQFELELADSRNRCAQKRAELEKLTGF